MSGRVRSAIVLCALTLPFGVGVHLLAELVGLGEGAAALAPRHLYLAALALFSVGAGMALVGGGRDRYAQRFHVARLIASLPGTGDRTRAFAYTFGWQLAFFWLTQWLEGEPLRGGDVVLGSVTALLASAIGALVLALFTPQIVRFVAELVTSLRPQRLVLPCALGRLAIANFPSATAFLMPTLWSRPPPIFA